MKKKSGASALLSTGEITYIGLFVALMAICSWISIPMTIPFTMQTFAVFLTAALLGTKLGTIAVAAYMLLGAVGLPVFSGFKGGFGVLMGPTGGYIIGFIFTALITGTMIERLGCGRVMMAAAMLTGLAVCYAFGTVWFLKVYADTKGTVSVATALGWCVIPYILPDCVKILLAVTVAERLRKSVKFQV